MYADTAISAILSIQRKQTESEREAESFCESWLFDIRLISETASGGFTTDRSKATLFLSPLL